MTAPSLKTIYMNMHLFTHVQVTKAHMHTKSLACMHLNTCMPNICKHFHKYPNTRKWTSSYTYVFMLTNIQRVRRKPKRN